MFQKAEMELINNNIGFEDEEILEVYKDFIEEVTELKRSFSIFVFLPMADLKFSPPSIKSGLLFPCPGYGILTRYPRKNRPKRM